MRPLASPAIAVGLLVFIVVFQIALNVIVLSASYQSPPRACVPASPVRML